ncbi:Lrp/AsnC family transcriptional regulator [Loktanella sp. IMCC34160]|uniref:Lrp/AsnC family transcriptional regulator n=1 Tax=Loktanella sp. IMCC34160 TaxID=2510646 RepID=UPI00101B87EA|nr:Lrp/AsnC family transcriptional regulator [Loktanella sp. IMCC34160]RYG93047.1 Lrp/AsnC family transcriptional regulator [Loktanella sp. IMCC34160]
MLDDTDRRILRLLQDDPAQSLPDLAEGCGLTVGRLTRRIDKLRADGILRGQEAVIDWRALGFEVAVSLRVTLDKTDPRAFDDFIDGARAVPEVIEIQTFLGRVDVRLHIVARDLAHWQAIYRDRVLTLPHIADIEALMLVATVKAEEALPL